METKKTKSVKSALLLTCLFLISSFFAKAAETDKFTKGLSSDGYIGYYIIGGILGFGIIAFIIVSIIDKRHEKEEREHSNIKHIAHHKHHHHHRVIKKSA